MSYLLFEKNWHLALMQQAPAAIKNTKTTAFLGKPLAIRQALRSLTAEDARMSDIYFHTPHAAPRSFWQGTQPLWKAFWLLYVGVSVLYVLLVGWGLSWLSASASQRMVQGWNGLQLLMWSAGLSTLLYLAYFVVCLVVVWRCSARHPNPVWRWGARGVMLLHMLWWLANMAILMLYFSDLDLEMWRGW